MNWPFVVGVFYMLEEPDLHLSHGERVACAVGVLNIEAVTVDGVFCC